MLGVNEVFVQLAHHARHRDDAELADWLPERAVAESVGKIVRPDGFGRWREHGRTVAFFVECDNGTEKLDTLLGKLDQYRELADADIRQPILFVVRGMKRHNNFHRRAASHPGVLSGELIIASISTDTLTDTGPADAQWLHARSGRSRLVDLPAPRPGRAAA